MKINFQINNIKYDLFIEKNKNFTILQACESKGIIIPRFCFHDKLTISGNCRMCLVEVIDNQAMSWAKKPIAACTINISEGLAIFTNTTLIKKAREGVLEFLLSNHPLDCPVCDQGGACDLQDQGMIFGNDSGRFYEKKRFVNNKNIGPFVKMIMTRCIHCTRCVRFGNELGNISVLGVTGRGGNMEIGNYIKKLYKFEFSGSIIDLCPVGALTSKPYSFIARPWESRISKSLVPLYSTIVEVRFGLKGRKIVRILPSLNYKNNKNDWITDTIRFCYDGLQIQRLNNPLFRSSKTLKFFSISWNFAFFLISNFSFNFRIKNSAESNLSFFFGRSISVEIIFILKKFFHFFNVEIFLDRNLGYVANDFLILNFFDYDQIFDQKFFKYDGFIFVGVNLRLQFPLINIKIKKLINNKHITNLFVGIFHSIDNLTYNAHLLGNTITSLNNMFLGKHQVCSHLLKLKNVCFFFDPYLISVFNSGFFFYFKNFFFNFFRKIGNIFFNIKIIFDKTLAYSLISNNFLKSSNYNFLKFSNYNFSCVNFFINTDDFKILKSKHIFAKNLNIFMGTNGNSDAIYMDLVLPSTNFVESKYNYLDISGQFLSSKIILNAELNVREDWKILFDFYNYYYYFVYVKLNLDKKNTIDKLVFLNKCNINSNKNSNSAFKFEKSKFQVQKNDFIKCKHFFFIEKLDLQTSIFDYSFVNLIDNCSNKFAESIYIFDPLTRSSNNLLLAHYQFETPTFIF